MQGKIIKGIAGFYYVHDGKENVYECKAKGIFRNKKIKPLVGDNVLFDVLDEKEKKGNIKEIAGRKNELIRPAVSNVDQALVFFASVDPNPNFNLLDRFLVMMERCKVPVHICFNKIDLIEEEYMEELRGNYKNTGYSIYFTSTYTKEGIEEIKQLLKGKTTVLAGPSGAGKSSITNEIFPEASMETGILSDKIKRGKHTTRHSELFYIGEDSFIMDTPGFSSMYLADMEAGDLRKYYPEFTEFESECRFLSCVHVNEPVCGVKEALKKKEISRIRYDNYIVLYNELKEKRRY